jgi:hypothetical protein
MQQDDKENRFVPGRENHFGQCIVPLHKAVDLVYVGIYCVFSSVQNLEDQNAVGISIATDVDLIHQAGELVGIGVGNWRGSVFGGFLILILILISLILFFFFLLVFIRHQ